MKKIISILMMIVLVLTLFVACTQVPVTNPGKITTVTDNTVQFSQQLKKFSSAQELKQYLDDSMKSSQTYNYYGGGIRTLGMLAESAPSAMTKSSASDSAGSSPATDFSQTNVQVAGVDEPDFVKNDGKYIYVISGNKLVIVDAFPADVASILSKTELIGTPQNMFLNGDKLVVFTNADNQSYIIPEFDFMPRPRYVQITHALVYDVSDKAEPQLVNDFNINGYYDDARMIGDYVYFIAKDSVYYQYNYVDLPVLREGSVAKIRPDVFYFDNPENNFVFHTVASFNIKNDNNINAKTFMMGYSNTLYVSESNIYITYQKNLPWRYYEVDNEDRFFSVIVPLLPSDVQSEIESIKSDSTILAADKWSDISSKLEDMYNSMTENEKTRLTEQINDAIQEYETKREIERRKTIIHKIAIDKGNIEYKAKAEVNGYLLNQFSMDENAGNLRLATTTDLWTSKGSQQYNNVYVLDENMNEIGALEKIAPDERIYSTRFMGDRLYMVTFKRMDPLFVIDLKDATNPKVLGELKIPGFSDYLHPYDDTHIIGVGKETGENEWGGISTKGVKVALFDVSDVTNPKLVDSLEIGKQGTDSPALYEHKAFMFDKRNNLLVLPIREVTGEKVYNTMNGYGYYEQKIWQGAYVLKVTVDGISVDGKISHNEAMEQNNYYWYSPYAVTRSLYMDDVLYTLSSKKIVASDIKDVTNTIGHVDLPYSDNYPGPIMY